MDNRYGADKSVILFDRGWQPISFKSDRLPGPDGHRHAQNQLSPEVVWPKGHLPGNASGMSLACNLSICGEIKYYANKFK
ncbi:MAG: hypothetical protein U0938_12425 [Thiobacillus sp.]|nr:hypothetical protein [Thiobacillus sp.]